MKNSLKLLQFLKNGQVDEFKEILKRDKTLDVNYFYRTPDNGTLLEIACRSRGNRQFVQILLQNKADPNLKTESNQYPIHEAVQYADEETLTHLTEHENHEAINLFDSQGNAPLHMVIKQNNTEFLKILLRHRDPPINININSFQNPTPLHLALLQGHLEAASLLLQYPDIDLDYQKDSQGNTCGQLIQQNYPNLLDQLPKQICYNPKRILWSLLYRKETEEFIRVAQEFNASYLDNIFNDKTYLQFACNAGLIDVIDKLLEKGVNPNKYVCNTYYSSPINTAAFEGSYEVFKCLLENPSVQSHNDIGTILHIVIKNMLLRKHKERCFYYKFIELIFNKVIPRSTMAFGNNFNAFYAASILNDDQVTKVLIYTAANLCRWDEFSAIPWTTIKATILEECLDDCIYTSEDQIHQEKHAIKFSYKLFFNTGLENTRGRYEMGVISAIEKVPHLRKLLKHPVLQSFLHMKWCLIKKYYYINFIIYFFFYIALNFHIILNYSQKFSHFKDSNNTNNISSYYDMPTTLKFEYGSKIVTLIFYWMIVLRESCQFCFSPRNYIRSFENWLEITMIFMAGAFILTETGTDFRSSIAAYAILTSSMEFVFILGKHPMCATHIEIFKTVAWNFFKFSILYSTLIISFAFSFYILFQGTSAVNASSNKTNSNTTDENLINSWQSPAISILKTITMLTGELGADSLPFGSTLSSSHFIFILFVFLITIVLYNLLNGLAVSDTQAITENAELIALVSRIKLISQLEILSFRNPFGWLSYLPSWCFQLLVIERYLWRVFYQVYGKTTKLFDNDFYATEIEVLPGQSNEIHLLKISDHLNPKGVFPWRMPSFIVEQAFQILENRKVFHRYASGEHSLKIKTTNKLPPKFQSIDNLSQTFIAQISELELKMDEKIANRDEKLIQRIETNMEQIKKLLEPLVAAIQDQK